MSFGRGISDVTWALSNNLGSWFLIDWVVNFFPSLFSGLGNSQVLGDYFTYRKIDSKLTSNWGIRRGGQFTPDSNASTLGHLVWVEQSTFEDLATAHAFVPRESSPADVPRFSLYGTLLLVEPTGKLDGTALADGLIKNAPFLLRGSGGETRSWTRSGGTAVPVYPGSLVPWFPAGALHFDPRYSALTKGGTVDIDGTVSRGDSSVNLKGAVLKGWVSPGDLFRVFKGNDSFDAHYYRATSFAEVNSGGTGVSGVRFTPRAKKEWPAGTSLLFSSYYSVQAPQDGSVTELVPTGDLARATAVMQAIVTITSKGVAAKDLLFLRDQYDTVVAEVASVAGTKVRVSGDRVATLASPVTARAVQKPEAPVGLTDGPAPNLLVAAAPAPAWAPGDVVNLAWTGGSRIIEVQLQVKLAVDAAVPTLPAHTRVMVLKALATDRAAVRVEEDVLGFDAAELPSPGTVLTVTGQGSFSVKESVSDTRVRIDGKLGGANGDALKVTVLAVGDTLGGDAEASGDPAFTYVPAALGQAPASGPLLLDGAGQKWVRTVSAVTWDALRLAGPRPAPDGSTYTGARYPSRDLKLDGDLPIEPVAVLSVSSATKVGANAAALRIHGFSTLSPLPPTTTPALSGTWTSPELTASFSPASPPPSEPVPSQLVVLSDATTAALALVKRVRMELSLERPLPPEVPSGKLELVALGPSSPEYDAQVLDDTRLWVKPHTTGGDNVQLPRFAAGQLVQVKWPADLKSYRIEKVDGTTLTLAEGPNLPPPATTGVSVQRLDAIDPGTGSTRAGTEGAIDAGNRSLVTFSTWKPKWMSDPTVKTPVAIIDGNKVHPAIAETSTRATIELLQESGATVANGAASLKIADSQEHQSASPKLDGEDLLLSDVPVSVNALGALLVLVPYKRTDRLLTGKLTPGTVKPPNFLDDASELTRQEAMIEHELRHTFQSQTLGPLMIGYTPVWAIDLLGDLVSGNERARITGAWKVVLDILELLSVGGVTNLAAGLTYGGIVWLLALAYHGLNQVIKGKSETSVLDFLDPFALKFFPATVPDANAANTVSLQPRPDGSTLTLAVGDPVQAMKASDTSLPLAFFAHRYKVSAVNPDGTYVLDHDLIPTGDLPVEGPTRALQIAKAGGGSEDPFGSLDSYFLRGFGMGWMTVLFDPWGQLHLRAHTDRGSFGDVLLRVARYMLGSKSWSFILGGRYFWSTVVNTAALSSLERDTSYNSGDTYYSLGLLRAGAGEIDVAKGELYVGDVLESWYVEDGGTSHYGTVVPESVQDGPAQGLGRALRVMPFVDNSGYVAADWSLDTQPPAPKLDEINRGAEATATDPGLALPDVLTDKDVTTPNASTVSPRLFQASPRGMIPTRPALERSAGIYVAFCRPSNAAPHRVTLFDPDLPRAARRVFDKIQIDLIHDLTVKDVEVRLGGRKISEGIVYPLVPLQQARLEVTPGPPRRYDLTVARPSEGNARRVADDLGLRAVAAPVGTDAEAVEISRVYRWNGKDFDGGGLVARKMHLPDDVHIPVRRFDVRIDSAVPPRASADPEVSAVAVAFKPGEQAFLLVPVRVIPSTPAKQNPVVTITWPATPPPDAQPPKLVLGFAGIEAGSSASLKTLYAYGGTTLSIPFPADDPPEEEVQVALTIEVGRDADKATLTAVMKLAPHFRLNVDGGGDFQVARGKTLTLIADAGGQPTAATADPPDGVAVQVDAGKITLTIADGAAPGVRRILASDAGKRQAQRRIRIV